MHMIQALGTLEEHWAQVLDEEMIVEEKHRLKDLIKSQIKKRKQSRFAMTSIRGRWRATMIGLHSPRNTESYRTTFRPVLVHREFDMLAGNALKIKKFQPRTLDPSESQTEQSESHSADLYRKNIFKTTASEYELYVRTEDVTEMNAAVQVQPSKPIDAPFEDIDITLDEEDSCDYETAST